ncbi:hypothetical protein B0T25DRAFT_581985 [Lasiosphaeria hispida]|uniref:Cupredoxin n=1 Tax=Lasiosphaeria hispida TaxID=260671 RepID=A0AAJ0HDR2_9PEZI|nr:hypothetical protein B0T25DRAFT_581985 [Lasiosphaeria hispida]
MKFSTGTLLPLAFFASSAAASHYKVTVGKNGQLKFDPETLDVKKGDTITYEYFARNHSVTQSSFDKPCVPLDNAIFSGFVPTDSPIVADRTTFTIEVKDEKPIWIYCSQTNGNHCQSGMVHAVNAPKQGNTFEAYKALAAKAQIPSLSPPDGLPNGGIRRTTVDVGLNGTLTYSPNNIIQPPRTVVEFRFNPRNHTVTESSFDKPCQPIAQGGFSSGFIATTQVPAVATFELIVNDTKPVWFYCGQVVGNHCQAGMVGAINAPAVGNTVDAFTAKAKLAPPPSVIPPVAPLGGRVFVKDIEILKFNLNGGNAIDVDAILGLFPTGTAAPTPVWPTETKAWENKPWETKYRPSGWTTVYGAKPTGTKTWAAPYYSGKADQSCEGGH